MHVQERLESYDHLHDENIFSYNQYVIVTFLVVASSCEKHRYWVGNDGQYEMALINDGEGGFFL